MARQSRLLSESILVDADAIARQSAKRRRHLNVVTYPTSRTIGFQLLIMAMIGHNLLILQDAPWKPMLVYVAVVESYCVLSWWTLSKFFDRIKAIDLGQFFLTADLIFYTGAVYVSGGHTSWLFFLLALRVADQSFISFRRAALFAHLAPLSYAVMLWYQHAVDAVAVDLGRSLAITLLLYLSSLYLLMSGLNAERLRDRSAAAVRLARQSIEKLQIQSTQLELEKGKAEAASAAKSQFLANMSHELKTPLNAVIGYSEMLIEEPDMDAETRRADLGKIRGSGLHLLALVNDVLELARLEAGRIDVALEDVDVPTIAQEAVMSLSSQNRKKSNTLTVHCDPNVGRMSTDPAKLRQILKNLLGNGLKFTEAGRVHLDVLASHDGKCLLFKVSDTGIGMSSEDLARLFQPFNQADGTSTRKHDGAALGLTLTKRYCEMLGGSLAVESTPSVGTVVTAILPLAHAPASNPESLILRHE